MAATQGIGVHLTNDEKRSHLTDLDANTSSIRSASKRFFHRRRGKRCCLRTVAFLQPPAQKSWHRPKRQHNSDKNQFRLRGSGTLPRQSVFVRCAAAIWWGIP